MDFHLRRTIPILLLTLLAAGCAGPAEVPAEEPEPTPAPAPAGPSYELIYFDPEGLFAVDDILGEDSRRVLAANAAYAGAVHPSPEKHAVVFAYQRADSTYLARFDPDADQLRVVHEAAGDTDFSVAWAPETLRLAYGYEGAGDADVMISAPEERIDPGCTSSIIAAHWPEPNRLVTGDAENRYVVSTDDCRTRASVDVRKMYHIRYAPGRARMAYIYRDLVYDRPSGSYVPDSALYISDVDGSNAEEIFDSSYRPRHMAWSPNGTTLALDVRLQEPPHRRRIVLRESGGGLSYLLAPDEFADADVIKPVWSPSGRNVALDLVRGGEITKAVRTFGRTQIFDVAADSTWGWIDDETIAFVTRDDSLKAVGLDGEVRFTLGPETTLVFARRVTR